MSNERHIEVEHSVSGHILVHSVIGLVLYGTSPSWNDQPGRDKVSEAVIAFGDEWAFELANHSGAIQAGIEAIRKNGTAESRDNWEAMVSAVAGGFLEEHRGIVGLLERKREMLKDARHNALQALSDHADEALAKAEEGKSKGTEQVASEAVREAVRKVAGTATGGKGSSDGGKVSIKEIDPNGDVDAQLKEYDLPEHIVALIKAMSGIKGTAIRVEADNKHTH